MSDYLKNIYDTKFGIETTSPFWN